MDAGRLHSAVNFGQVLRIQLVVRKLLSHSNLINPIGVSITLNQEQYDYRYQFDNTVSPWLNRANKQGIIDNFKFTDLCVSVDVEETSLNTLLSMVPDIFKVEIQ